MSEAGLKEGEEKGLDITKGRIGIDRGRGSCGGAIRKGKGKEVGKGIKLTEKGRNVGGRVKWGGRRRGGG